MLFLYLSVDPKISKIVVCRTENKENICLVYRLRLFLQQKHNNSMSPLINIGNIPFDLNVLTSVYPETKHIIEKASRLEADRKIIRLKRGLYVATSEETGKALNRNLIANHVYGPSYISREVSHRLKPMGFLVLTNKTCLSVPLEADRTTLPTYGRNSAYLELAPK